MAAERPPEIEATSPASRPELRVEDLARADGVSVDTIRFYQKRRLLPPPRREGRIALVRHRARRPPRPDPRPPGTRALRSTLIRRLLDGELDADRRTARHGRRRRDRRRAGDALRARRRAPACPEALLDAVVARGPARPPGARRRRGTRPVHRERRRARRAAGSGCSKPGSRSPTSSRSVDVSTR